MVIQWFSMESAIVNISSSIKLNEQYLTVVTIHNLKKETLSEMSLYIDSENDILAFESNDMFKQQGQYIKMESISPKSESSLALWTNQPILTDQIVTESEYKTRLDFSDATPFMFKFIWGLLIPGFIMAICSTFILWRTQNQASKIENNIQREQKRIQELSAEVNSQKKRTDRKLNEIRLYYFARISDLQKELSFWRNIVRKLLYDSKNEFQTADKVIDTVTSTLKTYTTREHNKDNMDELMYLAQLIADSREFREKQNSSD